MGDPTSLFSLDMTGSGTDQVRVETLGPGIHILENNPLHAPSPKADHVRWLLGDLRGLGGDDLIDRLRTVLRDHTVPGTGSPETVVEAGAESDDDGGTRSVRPPETLAACVHTDGYGTRSSTLVSIPAGVGPGRCPRLLVADGHPCTEPFVDVTDLFRSGR